MLTVGSFTPAHTTYGEYAFNVDIPEAGDWVLELRGTDAYWCYTDFDCVSLKAVAECADGCPIPRDTKLYVSEGAKVRLDFGGTTSVERVILGGQRLKGVVSAEAYPEFVSGMGVLLSDPKPVGMSVIVR